MKKAKNEAVAESNAKIAENKQKNKAAEKDNGIPSDKIRGKEKNGMEYPFKKVLYGYDPEEVSAYITELNETYESASRIHESKLSSMKEELVLSNRERDSYGEKYRECKAKLEASVAKGDEPVTEEKEDKSAEYEAEIAHLKSKLENAEFENAQLKQLAEQNKNNSVDEYVTKIAALETEKRQIGIQADSLKRENEDLLVFSQKYTALFEEHNAVLGQLELLKAEIASKEAEILHVNEEINAKAEELKNVSAELEELKKKAAEFEVKNSVLNKQISEKDEEITCLKDSNKTQAYEYAEKINAMESEQAKSKLAMQKELQLHNYHIGQAEIILSEMAKQMEQIKQSLNDIQSV